MPFISVIIPNYNHGRFLRQRIETVLCQTFQDFELLILDDASTDNSRTIIEEYKDHPKVSHILYNETNSGSPFLQWKKGIERAGADWTWIAESDDFAHPEFLQTAVAAIMQHPSTGLFYCDASIVDENGRMQQKKFSDKKNHRFHTKKWSSSYFIKGIDEINEYLKLDCTINNVSSTLVNKQLAPDFIEELGRYKFYGDWFFYLKLAFQSDIYYCSESLNFYREHAQSHLNANTLVAPAKYESFKILQLLYDHPDIPEKKKLLDHFSVHHLNFGLLEEKLSTGLRTLYLYFKADKNLALKFMVNFFLIKVFRKKPNSYPVQKEPLQS